MCHNLHPYKQIIQCNSEAHPAAGAPVTPEFMRFTHISPHFFSIYSPARKLAGLAVVPAGCTGWTTTAD